MTAVKPYFDSNYSSRCIRCGSARLVSKQWKEKVTTAIGVTEVLHTETVCPNSECQILVERDLEGWRVKRESIEKRRSERIASRQKKTVA